MRPWLLVIAAILLGNPAVARSQSPTVVRVAVADTLGFPVPDAAVRLMRDTAVVRSGRTAPDGSYRFTVGAGDTSLDLAVQKVGYVSTRRRVAPAVGAVTDVAVLVTPVATILDSVHITARHTADDIVPIIDADEIAQSGRNLTGLFRLIAKLRPRATTNTPRRAARPCLESQTRYYINEQWVNPAQFGGLADFPPEQIAYVQFVDCFDRSLDDADHPGARHVYVTLKPGAHYTPGGGVQIDSSAMHDAGTVADSGKALRVARGKVIGIYDEVSGDPIDGVEVKDVASGMFVHTTVTGTASLFFARTDATMLGLSKLGYRPMTMLIGDPWADTIPITVTMMPRGVTTVEAKRRSPADTVAKLIVAGFYDRRAWAPAAANAFLSTSDLRGATSISAAARDAGRPLCESAVYVDDAYTNLAAALLALSERARTIDDLFPVSDVLATETYVGGEIPPQFDRWSEKGAVDAPKKSSRCVTAIWTR
ncbi:MAG: carboxypeptidase-like regulatory domain-containing protein [Gemmatimonadales bacterium]